MTISSALEKAERLLQTLKAAQPTDPLTAFSPEQRYYYEQWWQTFKAANSDKPEALYAAQLNYRGWTPTQWLDYARIPDNMKINTIQSIYFDQLG